MSILFRWRTGRRPATVTVETRGGAARVRPPGVHLSVRRTHWPGSCLVLRTHGRIASQGRPDETSSCPLGRPSLLPTHYAAGPANSHAQRAAASQAPKRSVCLYSSRGQQLPVRRGELYLPLLHSRRQLEARA
jgi:hypothetical protein